MSDAKSKTDTGRALTAKLFAGSKTPPTKMPAKMQEYTAGHLFGEVWQDMTITHQQRSLITCTTLVALYRLNEQRVHFLGAKNLGIPRAEIETMITHVAHYAGWPCAASAFQVLNEVWPVEDAGSPPAAKT